MGIISSALSKTASKLTNFGANIARATFGLGVPMDTRTPRGRSVPTSNAIDAAGLQSANLVLGLIYRLMIRTQEDEKLGREQENNQEEQQNLLREKRNNELLKALTVRRIPVTKKVKTEIQKPEPKAEIPKVKKGKTPAAPKPTVTKPTVTKPTAVKAPSTSPTAALAGVAVGGGLLTMASSVIAKEEGLPKKGKAYWDPPGQSSLVSIGYGHQIKQEEYKQGFIQAGDEQIAIKGDKGIDTVMTPSQAQKLLQVDLPRYEKNAKTPLGDSWNKLNDMQKSALMSYAYNTGSTASLVKQGLKEAIDSGNMKEAANIIRDKGIKTAGGKYLKVLDERRHKEAALFESQLDKKEISKAVPIITPQNTGTQVDTSSKENKELKTTLNDKQTVGVNTTTVINQSDKSKEKPTPEKTDDRPIIIRKSGK